MCRRALGGRHFSTALRVPYVNRRRLLTLGVGLTAALSGCSERSPSGDTPPESRDESVPSTITATSAGPTEPAAAQSAPSDRTPGPAPHLGRFVLWNDDAERHRIGLSVSRGEEMLVDERRDLAPGDAVDVDNPIETQGTYAVVATVDGHRRAERVWRISDCESAEYLQVSVERTDEVTIRTMRRTVDPPPTC